MFFWSSLLFSMIQWMLAIWSLVPLPFLKPAWTSGISQFTYCWSLAWRFSSITLLVCAAAAAKSLQSCPTLCDPIDGSPPDCCPWDSPGKNTGVGCHFLLHTRVWDECSFVQQFEHSLVLPFFEIGMKTDFFQSCAHCWVFQIFCKLSAAVSQHHLSGFEIAPLEFHHLH